MSADRAGVQVAGHEATEGEPRQVTVEAGVPEVGDPSRVSPRDARELTRIFLVRLQELEEGTPGHQYVRNTLIEMNLSLVQFAASRFRGRGQALGQMDDIVQVGTIGLIKAIDRFDLSRETEFTTFAIPYIVGEIKRFFRDTTWAVRVPRRLQELRIELGKAKEELSGILDRDPSVSELAQFLELGEEEILEGLVASNGYVASSLDAPYEGPDAEGRNAADFLGDVDERLELVEQLHSLKPLLGELGERDRRLLEMRFGQEMTQAQIGAELGLSQMHVSRLLTAVLRKLRRNMLPTG
ncbi:RNA polymerase [Streptomyces albus]|uniref:RNA polymerase n=1 Tax=Streptomyces albus (strain ATCC 21838 / DSM 41398 / FERM P-419 / JCM 4703 / NBRC 107858) TaxID=1081613 RepID=A0A0B5ESN9_STRA4|nr:RNA polymerase [Streptomyces albus]AOU75466.1 RNA polymerase, sigma 28 subunit, Sig B/F/G subfamily [Streptomyces albus]AYN31269.1 SigB/SigF/SigG family RNA polymerase sigma factor [Streptomyces albus]